MEFTEQLKNSQDIKEYSKLQGIAVFVKGSNIKC
jgi:hypothetical protein